MVWLQTVAAGFVGTAAMLLVMYGLHRAELANADMTRALGSWVTRRYEGSFLPGLLLNLLGGVAFAVPYTAVLGALSRGGPLLTAGLGVLMGLAHGLVMSLVLISIVSERHPLERFRGAGVDVAAAHVLGHVVYGLAVAVVVVVLGIDWGLAL